MTKRRRTKRVYTLRFDNGPDQKVKAYGPTEAVAARAGAPLSRQPYGITDETAMAAWIDGMQKRTFDAMNAGAHARAAALAKRDDFTPRWLAPAKEFGR